MTTSNSNSLASSSSTSRSAAGFDNLPNSSLVFDRAAIKHAIDQLAVQLNVELHGANPVFLSVLHGGLPFTSDLLMRFQGDRDLGCVHVGRYGAGTQGGELTWHMQPSADLTDRLVVFVDDVLDKLSLIHI